MLLTNIHQLLQVRPATTRRIAGADMAKLPLINDAYLLIEDGLISDFGPMAYAPTDYTGDIIDCDGQLVLPTWCDSHTHIVYAGDRSHEWVARLEGKTYAEIAAAGGGILNSAKRLNETPEEDLYQQSKTRLETVMALGTGAIEIKSGYGLTVEGELKMLRVIRRLREEYPIPIKATFLGAHAIPANYKTDKAGYLRMLTDELMPKIAEEGLADFVDVFCEDGYFSVEDTELVMVAGIKHGLVPKIHVNQFTTLGGVAAAVQHGALSVDHLEELSEADVEALKGSETMPVALPGCSFFLGIPYTPARRLMDAGLPVALATDYNPGSAPSGNMNFALSLACTQMKMLPEEAINAATLNGAYAMGLEKELGSITVGKRANLLITEQLPSFGALPYNFGMPTVSQVVINGAFL
ncbi:MAG: imidazolonepropionase [Neolewinella sp.]|jgi:imidazolonepropionase